MMIVTMVTMAAGCLTPNFYFRPPPPPFLPGDVVLWVFAVIGQSSKEVTGVANQREAVSEARAGGRAVLRSLSLQPLPFPAARLRVWEGERKTAVKLQTDHRQAR